VEWPELPTARDVWDGWNRLLLSLYFYKNLTKNKNIILG